MGGAGCAIDEERVLGVFGGDEKVARAVVAEGEISEFAGIGFGVRVEDTEIVISAGGEVGDMLAVGRELGRRERVERRAGLVIDDHPGLAVGGGAISETA